MEFTFHNGVPHGYWTTWHENGQKHTETFYRNGKEHGISTIWDEKGKVLRETLFEEGKEVSELTLKQ